MISTDWKTFTSPHLHDKILVFVECHFRSFNIDDHTIDQICEIPEEDIFNSFLSLVQMHELIEFQQKNVKFNKISNFVTNK